MPRNLFDQLGEQRIPQRPSSFQKRIHERINWRLTMLHFFEVAWCVLPYAVMYFLEPLLGAVNFTFTGRYREKGDDHAK